MVLAMAFTACPSPGDTGRRNIATTGGIAGNVVFSQGVDYGTQIKQSNLT